VGDSVISHSLPNKSSRLISLDVVRGITIAFMILVNDNGSERYAYWPLKHAAWSGWTPTDLVFRRSCFSSARRLCSQRIRAVRAVSRAGRCCFTL